jgi:hypothetical protein
MGAQGEGVAIVWILGICIDNSIAEYELRHKATVTASEQVPTLTIT